MNNLLRPRRLHFQWRDSNRHGVLYRESAGVRINFSVPAEWLNRQENVEHASDQPTDYTYDDNGPNVYVLLNGSEERFNQVLSDRERWFRFVMGQDEVARLITPESSCVIPLPDAISSELSFKLGIDDSTLN